MSNLTLALRQVRFENRSFWRNPAAAFFTFAFPLMFLVIFNLLFGGNTSFYTPAIIAFSVVNSCFTNLAMGLVFARDQGVLKRSRGTPLPAWVYLFGRVVHTIAVMILLVAITTAFGRLFYDVQIPTTTMPAFLVSLVMASACFSALGIAMTAIVPNAEAAPAVINATILPLLFISDVFIPLEDAPKALTVIANIFPVKHASNAMLTAFDPRTTGSGFVGDDFIVLGIWFVLGLALALKYFDWEPHVS